MPIHEDAPGAVSADGARGSRRPSTPLAQVGLTKEVAMPSAGRILCGLCADQRRVLVAGLDEDRQLHLLAARPSSVGHERAGRGAARGSGCAASHVSVDSHEKVWLRSEKVRTRVAR